MAWREPGQLNCRGSYSTNYWPTRCPYNAGRANPGSIGKYGLEVEYIVQKISRGYFGIFVKLTNGLNLLSYLSVFSFLDVAERNR